MFRDGAATNDGENGMPPESKGGISLPLDFQEVRIWSYTRWTISRIVCEVTKGDLFSKKKFPQHGESLVRVSLKEERETERVQKGRQESEG